MEELCLSGAEQEALRREGILSVSVLASVSPEYLGGLGIASPADVISRAGIAAMRATRRARDDRLSGAEKKQKPANVFARPRADEEEQENVDRVPVSKEATPAAVRRYRDAPHVISLVSSEEEEEAQSGGEVPEAVARQLVVDEPEMVKAAPRNDAFGQLMKKSAFFNVKPKPAQKKREESGATRERREEAPVRSASVVSLSGANAVPLSVVDKERELLSDEQKAVLNAVMDGKNIFFTGSAGVGKSFTMRVVIDDLKRKYHESTVFVTASTGIAATHISGTTLHSFAGIGLGADSREQAVAKVKTNKTSRERWQMCRALVIDEISMISAGFFELLDAVGQNVRGNSRPFGGIQLVVAGDFLQLPPVEQKAEETYVFESEAWRSAIDVSIELKHVFRQKNESFVQLLQSLRLGIVSDAHDELLRSRMHAKLSNDNGILPTRLYTHRNSVERENEVQLNVLAGKAFIFVAKDSGEQYSKDMLAKNCMAPATLKLKTGAQVMLLKNLNPPHLVNGSRGRVIGFERMTFANLPEDEKKRSKAVFEEREYPRVRFDNGQELVLTPAAWEVERAGAVMATRAQVPLCLAWALSVHKCQGMTIDCVEVDIASSWDPGQAYVALSRCTSLDGLSLLGYKRDKIRAHQKVLEFYQSLQSGAVRADKTTIGRFAAKRR